MLVFQGSIHGNIQMKKGVNIHNDIKRTMFKEILKKISNVFLPYHNSFAGIK